MINRRARAPIDAGIRDLEAIFGKDPIDKHKRLRDSSSARFFRALGYTTKQLADVQSRHPEAKQSINDTVQVHTPLGELALQILSVRSQNYSFRNVACTEAEPRFLKSLGRIEDGAELGVEDKPAIIYLDQNRQLVGLRKNSGEKTVLELQSGGRERILPLGTIASSYDYHCDDLQTSPTDNPQLLVATVPDGLRKNVLRISSFSLPTDYVSQCEYVPELKETVKASLGPYAASVAQWDMDALVARIHDIARDAKAFSSTVDE